MASDKSFVDFALEQMAEAGQITCKKMFGEYGVYCDGKIVALVCDNRLFIKPTAGGLAFAGAIAKAPPYPGAKEYLLIEEQLEDPAWLAELVRITAAEVVPSPPKKKKSSKGKA
ncbi:MAG: TfoX/Sxy family protein [Desulforhopalus sp.]|nr:TfoX/Sxy family protein [Desulforhopalus sp.]